MAKKKLQESTNLNLDLIPNNSIKKNHFKKSYYKTKTKQNIPPLSLEKKNKLKELLNKIVPRV